MLTCPKCHTDFIRIVPPQGPGDRLATFFSIYPHLCQICTHRFRARSRQQGTFDESERRTYERIPVMFPTVFSGKAVQGRGVIVDLSMGGCWVTSERLPALGAVLELEIHNSEAEVPIKIDGAVVRVTIGFGFACEFVQVRAGHERRLQAVVEDCWKRGRSAR